MGVRSTINERRGLVGILTAGAVVLAISFLAWQRWGDGSYTSPLSFYSDDDGASYFIAASNQIPPFDHHGKTAVLAAVYRCGATGKPFVGYLMKYAQDETQAAPPAAIQISTPVFMKKPHDGKWTQATGNTARQCDAIATPACPRGETETITVIAPSDPDNGAQPE